MKWYRLWNENSISCFLHSRAWIFITGKVGIQKVGFIEAIVLKTLTALSIPQTIFKYKSSSRGFQYLYLYRNLLVVVAVVVIVQSKTRSNGYAALIDVITNRMDIAANTNTKNHQLVNDNNTVIVILDIDLHWDSHFNWVYQWRLSYSRFADDQCKYK